MQARYYDPVIGRFYSNDPVSTLEQMSRGDVVHGFNRYTYANNNPYKFVDPTGEDGINIGVSGKLAGEGGSAAVSIRFPGITNEKFDIQLKLSYSPGIIVKNMMKMINPESPFAQGEGLHSSKATVDIGYDTTASEGHSLALNIDTTAGAKLLGITATHQDVTTAGAEKYPTGGTLHIGPQLGAEVVPVGEATISARQVIEDIADLF